MPEPKLEFIPRHLTDTVRQAMSSARVVALLGPRQAGKSTLARMAIPDTAENRYLTLDDPSVLSAALADPVDFIAAQRQQTVIDEIQRAPDLMLAIKMRVDTDATPGQFLITGSANLKTLPTVADALPGRVDYLTLWPFTQGELRGIRETFLERLFESESVFSGEARVGKAAYAETILTGGFPEAIVRGGDARRRFFESYLATIIDRDVADAASLKDPAAIGTVLRLLASRAGGIARYESLGQDAGLSGKTAKSHVEVLERLFLVRVRRAWHVNLGNRQVKAPKVYVSDSGLAATLMGANETRFVNDGNVAGSLVETFVANELERQATSLSTPTTFWHYRDGDREVDIVAERPSGEVVGVEVKASATVRGGDLTGLKHLREKLGDRFRAGIVLYTGARAIPFGDRLWAVPLEALWRR